MAAPAAIAGLWIALVKTISAGVFNAHKNIFLIKISVRLFLFSVKVAALLTIISLVSNGVVELFNTFAVTLPPMLGDGLARILPGNFVTCLSAILVVKGLAFAFAISSKLISMFLSDF